MFAFEIVLLGMALAIDAAVVTFAVGVMHLDLHIKSRTKRGFLICFIFGFFQALMVALGSYAGQLLSFSNFGHFFQIGIGFIFFGLAIKMIQESFNLEEKKIEWGVIPVVILAFATSIDALASGVSLGNFPRAYFAAFEIGVITFFICGAFYFISQFFQQIPDKWLLRIAALIFFFLSGQVFWNLQHLFIQG